MADHDTAVTRPVHRAAPRDSGPALLGQFGAKLAVAVIGAGLLVIGLGWYGASGRGGQVDGATTVTAQLPYLLSGGFLGLSLVVVGSALLVVQAGRLDRARLELLLDTSSPLVPLDLGSLVAAGAASYHDPGCRHVDGSREVDYVTVDEALTRGLQPCRLCRSAEVAGA